MVDILKKRINLDFDAAVKKIEDLMGLEGYMVLLTKNIDESITKSLGLEKYPRYTFILGCRPGFAKEALDISKSNGLLFPCSFTVYEDEGDVFAGHVSIMKISTALGFTSENEMSGLIKKVSDSTKNIWNNI